jgi:hypothetical protein
VLSAYTVPKAFTTFRLALLDLFAGILTACVRTAPPGGDATSAHAFVETIPMRTWKLLIDLLLEAYPHNNMCECVPTWPFVIHWFACVQFPRLVLPLVSRIGGAQLRACAERVAGQRQTHFAVYPTLPHDDQCAIKSAQLFF